MKPHRRPDSEMKDSELEWIEEIPKEWKIKRVKSVCELIGGGTPNKGNPEYWEGGSIPWATPTDFQDNPGVYINTTKDKITQKGLTESSATLIPTGSVIMCSRASIGDCKINTDPITTNQGFCSFICKEIINKYLQYSIISSLNQEFEKRANKSTFAEISRGRIGQVKLVVASLQEQNTIVSFLDIETSKIQQLIEAKTKQIDLLQEHEKSLIHHAVTKGLDPKAKMKDSGIEWIGQIPDGWKARKLKNVLYINLGQSPEEELNIDGNGMPFYQGNADFGEKYPKPSTWCVKPKKIAEKNDLLVSVRAPVGELNVCREKSGIGRGVTALSSQYYEYYYYVLIAVNQEMEKLSTGSTFDAIGYRELSQIKLPTPPTTVMCSISTFLDTETSKIHNAIDKIENEIAKLEEYRKALIYEVVTGKVKVS